jgi:PAS domain S-box-containing protein
MQKILYIDDEESNLITLKLSLKKWFDVFTLLDAEKALDIIEKEQIRVVITDQRMPGLSGLECARKIKAQFKDVVIIILTAYDDNETMLEAINMGGIYRYLLKPWDIKDIRQTLISAFETYDLREKNISLFNGLVAQNKQLALQERRYRLLFENSNDAITILEDSYYHDSNDVTYQFFQCTKDQFLGRTPWELSPEVQPDGRNSREKAEELIKKAGVGIPQVFEWQHKRLDGSFFDASISLNLVETINNRNYIQAVLRDITLQKKAEIILRESEEKYRLIFENSPLGIAHFNRDGVISRCNKFFEEIIGVDKNAVVVNNYCRIVDKDLFGAIERILQGSPYEIFEGDYNLPGKGRGIPIRAQLTAIKKHGELEGGIMLLEDLSEKKKREELEKQVSVARESARFKQNFLAGMSHEIRTPLTGVMGMVDILEQTNLDKDQKEYIGILKQSGEDLREIINQVLDFSKIEAGKVTLKTSVFPFENVFAKAEKLFRSICKKDILFEIHKDERIPAYITADEVRVMQIVNNFLSNAVKFTDLGKITISSQLISSHKENQDILIKISISDTGRGISPEQQLSLFNPFTQLDFNDQQHKEGTGLGLSICRELALMHGGETGVDSKPGIGSTFWFTFLAQKDDGKTHRNIKKTDPESAPKGLRILVAEDKLVNQKVIRLILNSMGYKVDIAENGQQALDMFKPGLFDLILMDIQMPVMGGIVAIQKLKEAFANELPPIIGLSANAMEGDRERFIELGMDDYLTKPLMKEELLKVLSRLFP